MSVDEMKPNERHTTFCFGSHKTLTLRSQVLGLISILFILDLESSRHGS
jgi:hypothetical protein